MVKLSPAQARKIADVAVAYKAWHDAIHQRDRRGTEIWGVTLLRDMAEAGLGKELVDPALVQRTVDGARAEAAAT